MAIKNKKITGKCKSCQAEIVWLKSHISGKNVPVNPEGVEADDVFFNFKKHVSHFATCIYAKELRKKAKVDPKETERRDEEKRKKEYEELKEKIKNDTRPFIINNKFEITLTRYHLLEVCSKNEMSYDDLVNLSNQEIYEWMAAHEIKEEENLQLSLL